jgi:hypothetical protein
MLKTMRLGVLLRRGSLGVATGIIAGLLLFLLFAMANRASLGRDLPLAETHVRQAFATAALQNEDWLVGNTDIGRHQYNDCLILYMAIDQQAPASQLAVSPIKPVQRTDETMCGALRAYAFGDHAAGRTGLFYHQYIHGHTMLARYLLPLASVEQIRTAYHLTQSLLVIAGILIAMATLARGAALARGQRTTENLVWLIIFLALSRWFGLESYGQSLSHAPSDAIILAYLLFLGTASARGGLGRRASLIAAALFGAATAIFEFLTGGIPFGLAIIIGGLPFALRDAPPREIAEQVVEALGAFCAAVATCMALKLLLALSVFGLESFRESASQLGVRLGMGEQQPDLGPIKLAKSLVKGLNSLAAGMHVLAGAMLAAAIGFGAWSARVLFASGNPTLRARAVHLLLSNLAIVAMLGLLWQHTAIHAWFMDRLFVWTIASGFALFAMAIIQRRHAAP